MRPRAPRELALFDEAVDVDRLPRPRPATHGSGALGIDRAALARGSRRPRPPRRGDLAATPGAPITAGDLEALLEAAH